MRSIFPVAMIAVLASSPAGLAAEMNTSGAVTYVMVSSETAQLPGGRTATTFTQKGMIHDSDPASPLNLSAHDCTGTLVSGGEGAGASGAGYCVAVDKDGDAWWLWWTSDAATGGTWGAIMGTGKYEGITGSGTTTYDAGLPDRSVIAYAGTLTLK
ncbi:MAG TPA: hypothetical protein VGA77_15195 [Propylenella sp.]